MMASGTISERKTRFVATMQTATVDDLNFVRGELEKKTSGGLNRIADTEAATAREFIELIDSELAGRPVQMKKGS